MASSRPDGRSPSPTWWWCPRSPARRSKGRFKRWRVAAGGLADRRDRVLPGVRRIRNAAACSTVPSRCSSRWSPSGYCPACTSGRLEPRRTASAPRPRGQSRMGPDPRRPCGARSRRRRTRRRGGPREAGRGGGGSKRRRRRARRAGASTKRCRSTDRGAFPRRRPPGLPRRYRPTWRRQVDRLGGARRLDVQRDFRGARRTVEGPDESEAEAGGIAVVAERHRLRGHTRVGVAPVVVAAGAAPSTGMVG